MLPITQNSTSSSSSNSNSQAPWTVTSAPHTVTPSTAESPVVIVPPTSSDLASGVWTPFCGHGLFVEDASPNHHRSNSSFASSNHHRSNSSIASSNHHRNNSSFTSHDSSPQEQTGAFPVRNSAGPDRETIIGAKQSDLEKVHALPPAYKKHDNAPGVARGDYYAFTRHAPGVASGDYYAFPPKGPEEENQERWVRSTKYTRKTGPSAQCQGAVGFTPSAGYTAAAVPAPSFRKA